MTCWQARAAKAGLTVLGAPEADQGGEPGRLIEGRAHTLKVEIGNAVTIERL